MTFIQIVLSSLMSLLCILFLTRLKNRWWTKVFIVSCYILSIVFIFQPELSNQVANYLGVGRGADMVFYLALVFFLFLHYLVYVKYKDLQGSVTELTRQIAIMKAEKMNSNDQNEDIV